MEQTLIGPPIIDLDNSLVNNMQKILHLNLKKEYFDEINAGIKPFEYRLDNEFWRKKLIGKHYDEVHFKSGYPKNEDLDKIIKKKYIGYEKQNLTHKHFGDGEVLVFAIHTTGTPI